MTPAAATCTRAVWCVRFLTRNSKGVVDGEGWCATQTGEAHPDDSTNSAKTLCGYFVVLPCGSKKRVPTCPECIAALAKAP